MGMLVNFLAVRNFPDNSKTFREFLTEVKANALKAYENQDYPFEELVSKLDVTRNLNRNPLFSTVFDLNNADIPELVLGDIKLVPHVFEKKIARFDIEFNVREVGDHLEVNLQYCTKLFKPETMKRFAEHFLNIIRMVVDAPGVCIEDIEILNSGESFQPVPAETSQPEPKKMEVQFKF
jgi:non-ribosomal peptide synthetase component F